MKAASPDLVALMQSREFRLADVYTISLKGGTVLRYTSLDIPLKLAGEWYQPAVIRRGRTRLVVGIEVDTLEISIAPTDDMTIDGNPFLHAAHAGAFDWANVKLERAYMPTWGDTSPGALHQFEGMAADVDPDGIEVNIKVWSWLALLNTPMPINTYSPGCIKKLYRPSCGVNKAGFAVNGAAGAGCTVGIVTSALGHAVDYFTRGTIHFTSGANAGAIRTVKSFAGGQFDLSIPLTYAPAAGDTFTAYPGCDRTLATCDSKFNNRARFRGFPWIPVPETAY